MKILLRVVAVMSLLLALDSAFSDRPLRGGLFAAAAAAFWLWTYQRSAVAPAAMPPHVNAEWARGVLAEAGSPRGVRAVKALRVAEPELSLIDAKKLVDRLNV